MAGEYNGYPNYETWNVVLWLFNDENYYAKGMRTIREGQSQGKSIDRNYAATVIRTVFDTHTPDRVRVDDEAVEDRKSGV